MVGATEVRSTMYRKTNVKQVTPKGVEKQLDVKLVDRKNLCCGTDAEVNEMIHMESDHRSVLAQFVNTASKKEVSRKAHIKKK